MYTADSSGRLHPVASSALMPGSHALERHAVAALRDDCAELQRVSESGHARISPHVVAWARNHSGLAAAGDADSRRPVHHASNGAGASAPLSFASDRSPVFEAHDCVAGMCVRPFPPLLVETCLQRYGSASTSNDASERATAAMQLEELFVAQCCQLLHGLRFGAGAGRDLFAPALLLDVDEWMRAALLRGEAKGRRAAEEALGVSPEDMVPLASPRGKSGADTYRHSGSNLDRASTMAAESTYATASAAQQSDSSSRHQRRATQDPSGSMIHHPFAPAAYEGAAGDGSVSARFIGGASEGRSGRGLSRRAQGAAAAVASQQQRPRQCLLSSLLGLIRFTNALATRLKYWRGQLKAKQQEIATLTAMAQANANKEAAASAPATDAATQRQLQQALDRITSLESSLATAMATLHEYESSGRPRNKHEYATGDDHIPWGANELADLHAGWNREREALQRHLEEARADATLLRDADRQRTTTVESLQGQNESLTARVSQLSSMLDAIKVRVGSREREWEEKEAEWARKHKGDSCGIHAAEAASSAVTPSSPSAALAALREELAAEKARHAAQHAKAEADWFAQMAARDAKEQSLQTTAIRAKQAHASVVRDYEDLRQENVRVQAAVDEEKKELETRLRKNNAALSDARSAIAALKSQVKKLQEAGAAAPAPVVVSAPADANGATRAAKEERLAKKREAAAAAEAQMQAEEEEAERAAHEQRQKDALAAAERIKAAAAARAKKEKQKKRAEAAEAAEAAAAEAAEAQAAAAAAASAAAEKSRKKKKRELPTDPQQPSQPMLPPPTALELSKPTPKLSSGYGRCVYEEGEWYEGFWVDFERSGQGEYHWKDGRNYSGSWLRDQKHGQGVYNWVDGDKFVGSYANDKMDGWGSYFFSDGTRYEGEWQADMSHGHGAFLYADGARFEGSFQRDQKHGPGKMYLPSGECFSEHWIQGKRISSISIKTQNQMQPQPLPPQAQPPPLAKGLSRIRMAAQEQLAAAAQSARGPGPRR